VSLQAVPVENIMTKPPNILFIMADQFRADYLACAGHPTIRTPNLDALARDGVRFSEAFVQAPVCGGSRMSFYTGRYAFSHGAYYNNYPLRIDEKTIGDYLRPQGYRVALVGKTHMRPDLETCERLGLNVESADGVLMRQCGFEPVERDDGLHPDQLVDPNLAYNVYLRKQGYEGDNPWHDYANASEGEDGEILSGWFLRNARLPARVREEHSETAYMTNRAMGFMGETRDRPWCLHLSYIKPHWPYMAPAPYHDMYSAGDILDANRADSEKDGCSPVLSAFMKHEESVNFSRDEVRAAVIPTYMGLITQLDHHIGRVRTFLKETGQTDNTIIVFTSDHGDYLGDHWLGEKDLFHDEVMRVPLIIHDPRPEADATRGQTIAEFAEAIDLVPTFLDWAEGAPQTQRLEGRSLTPLLRGTVPAGWRNAVYADSCFALRHARKDLGLEPDEARAFMLRSTRWKYMRFEKHPPLLYDLQADPRELNDLGRSNFHADTRAEMDGLLFDWLRRRKLRTTLSDAEIEQRTGGAQKRGIYFGVW
jgi:arylsulfatase A-like enzyme